MIPGLGSFMAPIPALTAEQIAQLGLASFKPPAAGMPGSPGMSMPGGGGLGLAEGMAGLGTGLEGLKDFLTGLVPFKGDPAASAAESPGVDTQGLGRLNDRLLDPECEFLDVDAEPS